MKYARIFLLILAIGLLAGCDSRQFMGVATGSSLGGMFGSAIGGIAGGYRGENVGTAIGMIAGGAIGAAATADRPNRATRYDERDRGDDGRYSHHDAPLSSVSGDNYMENLLEIKNIRMVDPNRNSILESGERAYVTMEIYNRSGRTLYDIAPIITCDNHRITVSPTAIVSSLDAGRGFRYKIEVVARKRLKEGITTFDIAFGQKRQSEAVGHFRIRTAR